MDKKKLITPILLLFTAIIIINYTISGTPLENELQYYREHGYDVSETTLSNFYDVISPDLATREVEVSKETLRERAYNTWERTDVKIIFTDGEYLWTLWLPAEGVTTEVSYWKP